MKNVDLKKKISTLFTWTIFFHNKNKMMKFSSYRSDEVIVVVMTWIQNHNETLNGRDLEEEAKLTE